jgi:hypothetical protein
MVIFHDDLTPIYLNGESCLQKYLGLSHVATTLNYLALYAPLESFSSIALMLHFCGYVFVSFT